MYASLRKELEARHSLLNLSIYDLVEEFARYSVYAVFEYLASSSNLSITTRCRASSLIYINADKYSKKHFKVREADALKQVDANVRERGNKNCSSLYYSDSNSNTATRKMRIKASQLRKASEEEELAKTKKEKREKEERLKALLNAKIRDSLSVRNKRIIKLLARAYILYFKELLSNNSRIFASVISITRTQAIKNKVVAIDPINSILCDLSDLLVIRFCIFSNSALENIGILINEEIVEMQTNTATALANKLAAVNKLFALVCSFRKVDRYIFRANNTISVTAQRTITRTIFNKFYNCKLEGTIIAKFYKDL
ncbi:hypothetical protein HBH42_157850 [Parastagonospora nodorum]|nr:hypothetical protein HBH42_157850 [Parastagonospora nodorum]